MLNFRILFTNFIFNIESFNILWIAFAVQSEEYAKKAKQMISHMKIEANDPLEKSEIWQCMYSVYFVLGCALTHLNSCVFSSVCVSCEMLASTGTLQVERCWWCINSREATLRRVESNAGAARRGSHGHGDLAASRARQVRLPLSRLFDSHSLDEHFQ